MSVKIKKGFSIQKSRFIDYLEGLKKREARGILAALRRGLHFELGTCVQMFPYVIPWLEKGKGRWNSNMHYLVASLFAYHPSSSQKGNLGDVFQNISLKRGQNNSLEQRFVALLRSNPEDLPFHMRQAISLAKSEKVSINWHELFYDLKRWPYESNYPPYEKWAQSFWKKKTEENNKNKNEKIKKK